MVDAQLLEPLLGRRIIRRYADRPYGAATYGSIATARTIAREAGDLTLRYYCQDNYQVEWKHDASPVTVADREAEQHLRKRIGPAFPADAILGEELGEQGGTSGFRWILDPIDGTKSFISGVPLYGTLVGIDFEGRSVVGVIYIPGLNEIVYAAAGQGAWYCRGDAPPRRRKFRKTQAGRGAVLHFRRKRVRRRRPQRAVRATAIRSEACPHLGRLLWISIGSHGPGGIDGRSEDERLGLCRPAAYPRRSWRHVHRLARNADNSRRRSHCDQRSHSRRSIGARPRLKHSPAILWHNAFLRLATMLGLAATRRWHCALATRLDCIS